MKAFKHQDIPAIDQVFQYGRASKAYKLVSSAACNYDRPLVMTECYGGIDKMPVANLYKEAMDQFAKGINVMVPHAVWYEPAKIIFQPDLSPTDAVYGPHLSEYNQYVGRLQRLLQGGRPVADIAVLYPIATLQGGYYFGPGKPYEGGVIPPEADYMEVGERLALEVRRDFTFLHPEVLEEKCGLEADALRLNNKLMPQQYKVMVLPGARTIHWSSLRKIKAFYDQGGKVIATTRLPDTSAEFGKDAEVRQAVIEMFGPDAGTRSGSPRVTASNSVVRTNAHGGRACFLASPKGPALKSVLDDFLTVPDVRFQEDLKVSGGNLSYLHKVVEGRQVYFFANSSDTPVDLTVQLRGRMRLEQWDPHTGRISGSESVPFTEQGREITQVRLRLAPVKSVFLVSAPVDPR